MEIKCDTAIDILAALHSIKGIVFEASLNLGTLEFTTYITSNYSKAGTKERLYNLLHQEQLPMGNYFFDGNVDNCNLVEIVYKLTSAADKELDIMRRFSKVEIVNTVQVLPSEILVKPIKESKPKRTGPSAFKQMLIVLEEIWPKLTNNDIINLQNREYCQKNIHLSYPLLLKVDYTKDPKDCGFFSMKSRYSRTSLIFEEQDYRVTNHVFNKNIDLIKSSLYMLIENKVANNEH